MVITAAMVIIVLMVVVIVLVAVVAVVVIITATIVITVITAAIANYYAHRKIQVIGIRVRLYFFIYPITIIVYRTN